MSVRASPSKRKRQTSGRVIRPKRYPCPDCGRRFDRPSSLKLHTFSHTGEKPHACSSCPSRFTTPSNLNRHRKTCGTSKSPSESPMSSPEIEISSPATLSSTSSAQDAYEEAEPAENTGNAASEVYRLARSSLAGWNIMPSIPAPSPQMPQQHDYIQHPLTPPPPMLSEARFDVTSEPIPWVYSEQDQNPLPTSPPSDHHQPYISHHTCSCLPRLQVTYGHDMHMASSSAMMNMAPPMSHSIPSVRAFQTPSDNHFQQIPCTNAHDQHILDQSITEALYQSNYQWHVQVPSQPYHNYMP